MTVHGADWFPLEAPALYSTEEVEAKDKIVVARYVLGGSQWFIVEYDPETKLAFGYSILNGDSLNSEWGYVSMAELDELTVEVRTEFPETGQVYLWKVNVERDTDWEPVCAGEVEDILIRV